MDENIIDFTKTPLPEIYGENCFNDALMRERLPKSIYRELKEVQKGKKDLSLEIAEVVASTMKDWAIEKGATHFTHWFQPMTGLTAEKHDSFISPTNDGKVILEFSGKELIKGEPDASSFPSGGLRATFEARGYTAWDTTSPAFLMKDNTGVTLKIPTAFFAYTGEALDKKVPLLKSMEAVDKESIRLLKALGNTTSSKVMATAGAEQEYFLIDSCYMESRPDLLLAGRTLFGSKPAKGQEMEDHYFGAIKLRVADFMRELNCELWKLGISAKTQHNEVAPNQFELAPIFTTVNVATDTNQLTMEVLQKVASRHGLVALLHEKPFAGVNGSGKHNNWSLSTDDGINLLEPGDDPKSNMQFLLVVSAIIKAVDKYATLLRFSAANAGNDHRLGANEAPPAIVSIFLGEELTDIFEKMVEGKLSESSGGGLMELGVSTLPKLPKDTTDRNRTSPFAFTGNKFEFRMVPSSASISMPNTVLNTVVAEIFREISEKLEKSDDIKKTATEIIIEIYKKHKRIIFNGNGYSDEWVAEAEKRGLPNLKSTVEAIPEIEKPEAVKLFTKHKVFTKEELESRCTIYLEKYSKQINIEAGVMIDMAKKSIKPAVIEYMDTVATSITSLKDAGVTGSTDGQSKLLETLLKNFNSMSKAVDYLEEKLKEAQAIENVEKQAVYYHEEVFPAMEYLRSFSDALEENTDAAIWPFASYQDLLFKI